VRWKFPLNQQTQISQNNSVNLLGGRCSVSGRDKNFHFKPLASLSEPLALLLLWKREDEHSDQINADILAGWGGSVCMHAFFSESIESIPFITSGPLRVNGGTDWIQISILQEPLGHRIVLIVSGSVFMVRNNVFVSPQVGQEICKVCEAPRVTRYIQ
jgi:hypothetical protein